MEGDASAKLMSLHLCSSTTNMDSQSLPKRPRKANFTDIEVRVMLEEISIDHRILFMANTQSVTNKVKARTWSKITEKVSACGVAVRSPQEVKDKWRSLKGAVLNKQRQRSKTGGGPKEKTLPYEDLILTIIGENSTLYTGIDGKFTPTSFLPLVYTFIRSALLSHYIKTCST